MLHNKTKKAIAISTIAGLLSSSCSGYLAPSHEEEQRILNSVASRTLPISDEMTQDDYEYLDAIVRITTDLIEGSGNQNVLSLIGTNPQALLAAYGYTGSQALDEDLAKILLAFQDVDLVNAVQNHDIESFLNLALEKDLLRFDSIDSSDPDSSANLSETSQALLDKISNLRDYKPARGHHPTSQTRFSSWFIDSVAIAVVVVLIGIEVGVVVMAFVLGEVDNDRNPDQDGDAPTQENDSISVEIILDRLARSKRAGVLDAYIQANGLQDIIAFANERVDTIWQAMCRSIDEVNPEFWELHSREEVRTNLAVTFTNYLFLCDNEHAF